MGDRWRVVGEVESEGGSEAEQVDPTLLGIVEAWHVLFYCKTFTAL